MNHSVESAALRLIFDDGGRLLSFLDRATGFEYVRPHGLWRLVLNRGASLEVEIRAEENPGHVTVSDGAFRIAGDRLRTHTGEVLDIAFEITGKLAGDTVSFAFALENRLCNAPGDWIREVHFPILALSAAAENLEFHTSEHGGRVQSRPGSRELGTGYMGMDARYGREVRLYPSEGAAMNCFALADATRHFYYGDHDPAFTMTAHVVEREERAGLNLLMCKFPNLAPGNRVELTGFCWGAGSGPWHRAADRYRAWAETWFHCSPIPEKIRSMQGWQRVIARSQYGENFFTFDRLPELRRAGQKGGIDTLFLFGWHRGGHDCDYPNYTVSEELGGFDELKRRIAEFRADGGMVNLYANGQLIDIDSDFYRNGPGSRVAVRNAAGAELRQFYGFSGRGVYHRAFGNRTFAVACPGQPAWLAEMKKVVDLAARLGCDGVFFDQLGTSPGVCCDPSHGHPVPYFGIMNARRDLAAALRAYAHEKNLTFGIELITDVTAPATDYIHTLAGGSQAVNPGWEQRGEPPRVERNLDFFRYTFPECVVSNREIRDDTDVERRVNRLVMQNLISDVEIHRCQTSLDDAPRYQAYLGRANAFRAAHADVLRGAKFRSTALHTCDNPGVDSAGHLTVSGEIAVLATQSWCDSLSARIAVPGRRLARWSLLNGGTVAPDGTVTLGRHDLALLIFV